MKRPVIGAYFAVTFGEAGVVTLHKAIQGSAFNELQSVVGEPIFTFYREHLADLESVAFEASLRCQLEAALRESLKSLKETGSAFPEGEE